MVPKTSTVYFEVCKLEGADLEQSGELQKAVIRVSQMCTLAISYYGQFSPAMDVVDVVAAVRGIVAAHPVPVGWSQAKGVSSAPIHSES